MTALIVVDVQNDFVEGGSLAVPGGKALVPKINRLIESHGWTEIVYTKDWHPPQHISFASTHGRQQFDKITIEWDGQPYEQVLWPDHCVQNSSGAAFVEGLDLKAAKVISKGTERDREYYSGFRDAAKSHETELGSYLASKNIRNVTVVGLALDFCVLNTALDAQAYGYETTVDTECVAAITSQGYAAAVAKMRSAGIVVK